MSNIDDVIATKNQLIRYKNKNVAFLHCVSSYPTKDENLNLNSIKFLSKNLGAVIGFSDHTIGYTGAVLAVACGAKLSKNILQLIKKCLDQIIKFQWNQKTLNYSLKK